MTEKNLRTIADGLNKLGNLTIQRGFLGAPLGNGKYQFDGIREGTTRCRFVQGHQNTIVAIEDVINHSVPRNPLIRVLIQRNIDGEWEVLGPDGGYALEAGGAVGGLIGVGPHTHRLGFGLEDIVEVRRLEYGLVGYDANAGGLWAKVFPFTYTYNGVSHYFAGGSIDLAAYKPTTATKWGWAKVGLDLATNTLVAVAGQEVAGYGDLTEDDLCAIVFTGYTPLAGVRLTEADTVIPEYTRFFDLRELIVGVTDHGSLTDLDDDDHAQYVLLAGRTGDCIVLADSTTTPPLNVTARAAAPSAPNTGDVYLDDGTNTTNGIQGFRRYNGAAWEDIGGGVLSHSALTDLGADDHTQYVLLDGRSGDRLVMADDEGVPPWRITARSAAPTTPEAGDVYLDDGTNTDSGNPCFRRYTGAAWEDIGGGAGSGETNTASNVGSAGTGFYDGKVGVDLQFRSLNPASAKLSVALDAVNQKVDIDLGTVNFSDLSTKTHTHQDAANGGTLNASAIAAGTLALARGGNNADLSATGPGVLQQVSAGANVSVGTVPETMIDDNAVTLAKLAHGTAGKAIGFDGDGAPVELDIASGGNTDIEITAGETLSERDFVYYRSSDSKWYQIDTNAVAPVKCGTRRAVVIESGGIAQDATGTARIGGVVSGFSSLTVNALVYGSTTAGGYTQTKPTVTAGGGQIAIVVIGVAVSATEVLLYHEPVCYINEDNIVATTGTLVVEHHSDTGTIRLRRARAEIIDAALTDVVGGGTASASSVFGGYPASRAFDQNTTTDWISSDGSLPQWVKYDFTATYPRTLVSYAIYPPTTANRAPKDFTFQGSNDDSSWDTLDTQTGQTGWGTTVRTFAISSPASYRYYRLYVTAVDGGSYTGVIELYLYEDTDKGGSPAVVGQWSIGTRDIAVRWGDIYGGSRTTKTTFKNVYGSGIDLRAFVEVD